MPLQGNDDAPEFYRRVYEVVRRIPEGRVSTYGDVAEAAGAPRAHRAVGTAMSLNQDGDLVPCHRVVRSDGTVGRFGRGGAGVAEKVERLRAEGVRVDGERLVDFASLRYTFP